MSTDRSSVNVRGFLGVLATFALSMAPGFPSRGAVEERAAASAVVVFVCEHGSAKSVVAASHFNALAAARGLDVRAVARGTVPDAELPAGVLAGLARDGREPATHKPTKLEPNEVVQALRVIAFLDLPADIDPDHRADRWQVPAVSVDYEAARAIIVQQVEALFDELAARPGD